MAKNPLRELLKDNNREQVSYDPGQQLISPRIQTGGNYRVVTQPTPKTNSLSKFASALKGGTKLYGDIVDVNQEKAMRDVQTMSDEEFDKHYNELIQGDKNTKSVFGYNKAFQQGLVERAYKDTVPAELNAIEQEFEANLENFNSIAEYDEAVAERIDDYMSELGGRFNDNVFAQEAHNVLASGKASKLKIGLHDKYEAKAKEFIKTKVGDDINTALTKADDETDFKTLYTDLYTASLAKLDGDKTTTNALFLESTEQHVLNQLNLQTEEGLENAKDIYEALYNNDPLMVGGKPIFETQAGAKLDGTLKASIAQSELNLPKLIEIRTNKTLDDYYFKYFQAEGDAEKLNEVDAEFDELLSGISQKESTRLRLLNEGRDNLKRNPLLFREEQFTKYFKGIPKNTELDFSNDFVLSTLSELDLGEKEQALFYKRSLATDKYELTPEAYNLSSRLMQYFDSEYRRLASDIFDDKTLNLEEKNAKMMEAQVQAKEFADRHLRTHIKDIAKTATNLTPIEETELDKFRDQGWSNSDIAEYELINDPQDRQDYVERINKEIDADQDAYERTDGVIRIKGLTKKTKVNNFKEATLSGVTYKDEANFLNVWDDLNANEFTRKEENKIRKLIFNNKREEALEFIWERKELTGFSEQEMVSGLVDMDIYRITPKTLHRGTVDPNTGLQVGVDPIERRRRVTVESIRRQDSENGKPRFAELSDFPITLNGGMKRTLDVLKNNEVEAYSAIAEKYGITSQQLFDLQKKYFIDHNFISDVEMGDDEDNDLDPDPEKKTLEDNEVEAIDSDIVANYGKFGLTKEPTNVHEQVIDKYNLRRGKGKIFINYKDFAKTFYKSRLPNANPEAIDRIVDAKFKLFEQRSPELIGTENKEVQIKFKEIREGAQGLAYSNKPLIEISHRHQDIEGMEQTIMHELVHASQFKGAKGKMTNLMTGERVSKRDYTDANKSFMDYLNSPLETDARLAEVARQWVLKGNEFIDPRKGTEVAEDALVDFLTHKDDDEFINTRFQLVRMLGIPDSYMQPHRAVKELSKEDRAMWLGRGYKDDSRVPIDPDEQTEEEIRKELRKNPNLELILESIGTLVQNESTQNPNKQIT